MSRNEHLDTIGRRGRLSATVALCMAGGMLAGCAAAPQQTGAVALAQSVSASADTLARATEARAKGDTDAALRLYVEAAEQDPFNAEALYGIGSLYEQGGDYALAARAYARAELADPEHAPALEALGLRYFADRQLDQARPLLLRAVAVDSQLWRSHNALGLIADARGEHDAAAAHFAAALAAHPGSATVLNNRGYSRYLAGDLDAAERDFRTALAADASYDKAWQNLGLVYARRGDYPTALATLERVVTGYVAANDVGYIAMLSGDYATAERLFAEAIRLSPRYYQTANENVAELRRRRSDATLTAR